MISNMVIKLNQKAYLRKDGSTGTKYSGRVRIRRGRIKFMRINLYGPYDGNDGQFYKASVLLRYRRMYYNSRNRR